MLYNTVQNIWHIHTLLNLSELAYHSSVLCGWHPAAQTAAEGARHTTPQNVEEWRFSWKLLHHCWRKGSQKWNSLCHSNPLSQAFATVFWAATISRSSRVNLLPIYRLLLALSTNRNCVFFTDRLRPYVAHFWSTRLSSIFCKFLAGAAVFVVGSVHSLASAWQRDLTDYPSWGLNDFSQPVQANGRDVSLIGHDGFLPNPSPFFAWFSPYHSTLHSGMPMPLLRWTISSLINPYKMTVRSFRLPVTLPILNVTYFV